MMRIIIECEHGERSPGHAVPCTGATEPGHDADAILEALVTAGVLAYDLQRVGGRLEGRYVSPWTGGAA